MWVFSGCYKAWTLDRDNGCGMWVFSGCYVTWTLDRDNGCRKWVFSGCYVTWTLDRDNGCGMWVFSGCYTAWTLERDKLTTHAAAGRADVRDFWCEGLLVLTMHFIVTVTALRATEKSPNEVKV